MKKVFGLTLAFSLMTIIAFAQVMEGEANMSEGTNNALSIEIPTEGNIKTFGKLWAKYMKQYGKTKRVRKTKEYFSDNASIAGMSTNAVDVYAKIEGGLIKVWFDLGGAYLNSMDHPDGYATGEKILLKFALEVKSYLVNEELEAEQKRLKKMQSKLKKLQKRKATLEANIESWKQKIMEAEEEIGTNVSTQEQTEMQIEEQQGVVEGVKQKLEDIGNF